MLTHLGLPSLLVQLAILPLGLLLALALGRLLAAGLRGLAVHSPLERLLVYWLLAIVALSWVGTVLAGLNAFRGPALLAGLLLVVIGSHLASRGSASPPGSLLGAPTPRGALLLVALVLAGAGYLFARPSESLFLMDDSAVYTIGGLLLARTGSLFAHLDSFWGSVPDFARQFYNIDTFGLLSRHFGPFYQWILNSQTLELGFLPLPKVWIALASWLYGEAWATWATPFFGLTALAALYGFCRRLLGWQAGLAAMILLAVSQPQIWFARYPISEVYAEALFLGGLYLAVVARQETTSVARGRRLAVWSALALAALTVTRFEAIVMAAGATLLLLLAWRSAGDVWRRLALPWGGTLAAASAFGLALSAAVARHYFFAQTLTALVPGRVPWLVAGLLALALLAAAALVWRDRPKQLLDWASHPRYLPALVAAAWIGWALIAAWQLARFAWGGTLAGWLAQYWTPAGLLLGCAGAVFLLLHLARCTDAHEMPVLLGSGVLFLAVYSANSLVTPMHPWAMRRLVPIALPALAAGTGGFLFQVLPSLARLRGLPLGRVSLGRMPLAPSLLTGLAVLLLLAQTAGLARVSRPILYHTEQAGFRAGLDALAASFPPGALLLFDNGETGERMTQALELLYGHPSLVLRQAPSDEAGAPANAAIRTAVSEGRRAFLVITDGDLRWQPAGWRLTSVGERDIVARTLRSTPGRPALPGDLSTRTYRFDVYEISPGPAAATITPPFRIDGSAGSYPFLRSGFYGWDMGAENRIARWTDGDGKMTLPWPAATPGTPATFCLALEISGGRPEAEPPASLDVLVEGVSLYHDILEKDFVPRTIKIPVHTVENQAGPELTIGLASETWSNTGAGDNRTLGIIFYGLQLLPIEQCPDSR